jgi:hypothetical protein
MVCPAGTRGQSASRPSTDDREVLFSVPRKTRRRKMLFVVSLTTSPSRLQHIGPTLDSLLAQTRKPDAIFVNLPDVFKRTGKPYVIPEAMKAKYEGVVQFLQCGADLGPITKLVPTLRRYPESTDVWIMTVDDDIRYLPLTLETYVRYAQKKVGTRYAYGLSGFTLKRNNIRAELGSKPVDVIEGYGSAMYHRSSFPGSFDAYLDVCLKEECTFLSDDLVISNWLELMEIGRVAVWEPTCNRTIMWQTGCILPLGEKEDALHKQPVNNLQRYVKARSFLKAKGLWSNM